MISGVAPAAETGRADRRRRVQRGPLLAVFYRHFLGGRAAAPGKAYASSINSSFNRSHNSATWSFSSP